MRRTLDPTDPSLDEQALAKANTDALERAARSAHHEPPPPEPAFEPPAPDRADAPPEDGSWSLGPPPPLGRPQAFGLLAAGVLLGLGLAYVLGRPAPPPAAVPAPRPAAATPAAPRPAQPAGPRAARKPAPKPATKAAARPPSKAPSGVYVLPDWRWAKDQGGYDEAYGTVRNASGRTVLAWRAAVFYYDAAGNVIAMRSVLSEAPLRDGQGAPFFVLHRRVPGATTAEARVLMVRFADRADAVSVPGRLLERPARRATIAP